MAVMSSIVSNSIIASSMKVKSPLGAGWVGVIAAHMAAGFRDLAMGRACCDVTWLGGSRLVLQDMEFQSVNAGGQVVVQIVWQALSATERP